MLRITVVESSKIAVTLRVEGRITGPWVEELRTACNVHTFPDEVQLSLELADISFAVISWTTEGVTPASPGRDSSQATCHWLPSWATTRNCGMVSPFGLVTFDEACLALRWRA